MNDQRTHGNAIAAAVIGAIATVLAGLIPTVIIINQRNDTTATSTSQQQEQTQPEESGPSTNSGSSQDAIDLDALAAACYDGDWLACDDLYLSSPIGSDYEWYGGTCGEILLEISEDSCVIVVDHLDLLVELESLCQAGDMEACDELYFESAIGSEFEQYGATCGERIDYYANGFCWELS